MTTPMFRRTSVTVAVLLLTVVSCKEAVAPATPSSLSVVQGNLQVAPAGALLPLPVVLRVRDATGEPLSDVPVSFQVTQGGGAVDPPTSRSDANGEVKVKWTLGTSAQAHTLNAAVPGLDPISLTATGVLPTDLTVVQGNNQVAKAGAQLTVPIVIRVTGGTNLPIPGVTVTFALSAGSMSPATGVTNANGEVSSRWTLGNQAGMQTATVTVLTLPTATVSATAN